MHRCPQCDYAYGPLPGVPAEPLGRFTATVRCPECSFEVPAGALLLVGSSSEAGAQPLTARRRWWQVMVALAPMWFVLQMGVEGIFGLISKRAAGLSGWDALRASGLLLVGLVIWGAWRRWTPAGEAEARAPASVDMRWLCVPGAIEVFTTAPGVVIPRSGTVRNDETTRTALRTGVAHTVHATADLRSVTAHMPIGRGRRWRAGDRPVAAIHANFWFRDRHGKRSSLYTLVIHMDTGADPGLSAADRAGGIIEAGDRIAGAVRGAVGMEDAVDVRAHASAGSAMHGSADAELPLVIDGALHAQRPWPGPENTLAIALCIPLLVAFGGPVVWGMRQVLQWFTPSPIPPLPGWMDWWAAGGAVALVVIVLLWYGLARHLRRRELARCRWEVRTRGLCVVERSMTLTGDPAGERTIDIPAEGVAAVEARTTRGRRQLVATGRDGRALARITLEVIPEGGAAALAQRVRKRLGGGARD
jgi:hypothetical protein